MNKLLIAGLVAILVVGLVFVGSEKVRITAKSGHVWGYVTISSDYPMGIKDSEVITKLWMVGSNKIQYDDGIFSFWLSDFDYAWYHEKFILNVTLRINYAKYLKTPIVMYRQINITPDFSGKIEPPSPIYIHFHINESYSTFPVKIISYRPKSGEIIYGDGFIPLHAKLNCSEIGWYAWICFKKDGGKPYQFDRIMLDLGINDISRGIDYEPNSAYLWWIDVQKGDSRYTILEQQAFFTYEVPKPPVPPPSPPSDNETNETTLIAKFIYKPEKPYVGDRIELNATDSVGDIVRYYWLIDDDKVDAGTMPVIYWTFNTSGKHTVKLFVADASGNVDSITKEIYVYSEETIPEAPTPDFMIPLFVVALIITGVIKKWRG